MNHKLSGNSANAQRKAHLVGAGIASLASAAYLIRDGKFAGANICIYEESGQIGGSMDAHGSGYCSNRSEP